MGNASHKLLKLRRKKNPDKAPRGRRERPSLLPPDILTEEEVQDIQVREVIPLSGFAVLGRDAEDAQLLQVRRRSHSLRPGEILPSCLIPPEVYAH